MTRQEAAGSLRSADARAARIGCGVTLRTIAAAIGVAKSTVWKAENLGPLPTGERGARYQRIIAGLMRHLEVPEEGTP